MFKVTLFATAAALVVTPVLAQQGRMALGEGEAVLISPDGAMYRSTVKVSDAKHQAAVAKGAGEVSAGTVLYRHGGKLFTVRCTGTDIGAWEEGYPGTENICAADAAETLAFWNSAWSFPGYPNDVTGIGV